MGTAAEAANALLSPLRACAAILPVCAAATTTPPPLPRLLYLLMLCNLVLGVGVFAPGGGWANDRFGAARVLPAQLAVLVLTMAALPLATGNHLATLRFGRRFTHVPNVDSGNT